MEKPLPQIFCFATNEWDTPWWMARQHLFTRLAARGWPVVYSTGVQSLWQRHQPKWKQSGLLHSSKTVSGAESAPLVVDRAGRLQAVWPRSPAWTRLAMRAHAKHLLRSAPQLAGRKRIAYLWNPSFWPYVDLIEADYVVFHIHDAWDSSNWSAQRLNDFRLFVECADLIITTAKNMARDLPGFGPNTARVLPHGVDFKAVEDGAHSECPADIAQIPRPRIGYTGRVNLKLDFPVIAEAASQRPDWHWVFVGATGIGSSASFEARPEFKADWERLKTFKNVHFLGPRDRREIPAYLHHFDVLALPFNSSYVGFPTKLFEYFASGKPVVSWPGENIQHFAHLIDIAKTADEWVDAIGSALSESDKTAKAERIRIARGEDWDGRTDTVEGWLNDLIA